MPLVGFGDYFHLGLLLTIGYLVYGEESLHEMLSISLCLFIYLIDQFWGFVGRANNSDIRPLLQLILSSGIFLGVEVGASSFFEHQLAVFSVPAPPCLFSLFHLAKLLGDSCLVFWVDVVERVYVDLLGI